MFCRHGFLARIGFALVTLTSLSFGEQRRSAVSWEPAKLVAGSPVLFRVASPARTENISALWLGHDVLFSPRRGTDSWYGLAGVPLETRAGTYDLHLIEILAGGRRLEFTNRIKIAQARYARITIKVAKQYTEPSAQQLKEIADDKELKHRVFSESANERLWMGPFLSPVAGSISDRFGTERVFNEQVQSRHLGLDYAVASGTNVHAVNGGQVILARPLFFEGNCVVIDHGQGLLSLYLHLSDFRVKEGDQVRSGQLIGVSGGSGRATGAHLHLAMRWQGDYLDPAILLKMHIPAY
jgi:murein DD-endopeptidase MepM/ murein hydrolase activator NlpD